MGVTDGVMGVFVADGVMGVFVGDGVMGVRVGVRVGVREGKSTFVSVKVRLGVTVLVGVRDGRFVEVGVPFVGVQEGSTKAVPVGTSVAEGMRVGVLVSAVGVNVI